MQLETADAKGIRNVYCDLSASPVIDLAGARMLAELADKLSSREMHFEIVNARGRVRDLLRAEGLGEKISGIIRGATISDALGALANEKSITSAAEA
jgi:sulfate permease, SulP family